jgi:GNAT superfamily N-acetyltransferase
LTDAGVGTQTQAMVIFKNGYAARSLAAVDALAIATFFEQACVACNCRFLHFQGDKNAWLARLAFEPEQNRLEFETALRAHGAVRDEARGVIASHSLECGSTPIVGWLKIAPAPAMLKLQRLSVYRPTSLATLAGEPGTWMIGCMLILEAHRGRGLATLLTETAIAYAKAEGAKQILALPRETPRATPLAEPSETSPSDSSRVRMHDEFLAQGPESTYRAAGFVQVAGEFPHPVLRFGL